MSIFDRLFGWSESSDDEDYLDSLFPDDTYWTDELDEFHMTATDPLSNWGDIMEGDIEEVREATDSELIEEYRCCQELIGPGEVPTAIEALLQNELNARMYESVLTEGGVELEEIKSSVDYIVENAQRREVHHKAMDIKNNINDFGGDA